jgi:hypothetical protein
VATKKTDKIRQLFKTIKNGSNQERARAAETIKRMSLSAEWWPEIRDLMRSKRWGFAEPRIATHAAGKIREPPPEVMDELIAAASPGYQGDVPQYFSEAAESAVRIDPSDPRLPDVLAHGLTIDNYQLQKSAVEALMIINSPTAREILRTVKKRLPREYTEQLVVKLLDRVERFLKTNP